MVYVYVDASEFTGRIKREINAFLKEGKGLEPHYLEKIRDSGAAKRKGAVFVTSYFTLSEIFASLKRAYRYSQLVSDESIRERAEGLLSRCGVDVVEMTHDAGEDILKSCYHIVREHGVEAKDAIHIYMAKRLDAYFLTGEEGEDLERIRDSYKQTIGRKELYKLMGM
jgi:predicted nucleic acid-binding protein